MLIGRTRDYAWSATSASNDNTDQFLEQLCNPDGSPATRESTHYRFKGRCRPMKTFNAGVLKGAGGEPDEQVSFRETVHGPVSGTVTVGGRPYAVSTMRSTRGREVTGAYIGSGLNEGAIRSAKDLPKVASRFGFTFNLFYVDHKDIGFFSAGRLPIRAPGTNPSLPTLGTGQVRVARLPEDEGPPAGHQSGERVDPQLEQQARGRFRRRGQQLDLPVRAPQRPVQGLQAQEPAA